MSLRTRLILTGVLFFILFVFFSFLVKLDLFTKLDFDILAKLQARASRGLDPIFTYIAFLGRFEILASILLIISIWRKKIRDALFLLSLFIAGHLIELAGKFFLHQPPPPFLFVRSVVHVQFERDYINPGSSYPSGHSFRAFFLLIILVSLILHTKKINLKNSRIMLILSSTLLLIPISKLVLGEHWPTDIVAGSLLGISLGLIASACCINKKGV